MKRLISTLLGCALLAACGGGGGGSTMTPPTGGGGKSTQVALKIKVNNHASITGSLRGRKYVSRNTAGIGVSYQANGTTTGNFGITQSTLAAPMFATAVSAGFTGTNTSCSGAALDGSFTCTLLIPAAVGYDDFQITAWDAAPGAGPNFFSGDTDLSTATVYNQLVYLDENNVFNFALSGVVESAALWVTGAALQSGSIVAGTPATLTLNVQAKDGDGNIIIGSDPYVDANGTPVTIGVSTTPTEPGTIVGSTPPPNGNITFSAPTGTATCSDATDCAFTQPGSVTVNYNGFDIASASFTGSVTGGLAIPLLPTNLTFTRTPNGPINVPAPLTLNVYGPTTCPPGPQDGAVGPDGYAWFAEPCGDLVQIKPGGAMTSYFAPGSTPIALTAGPDGKLWIAEQGSNQIGRLNIDGTGGVNFPGALPATQMAGSLPQGITLGSDDRLWFTENVGGYIGVMNADGTIYAQYNVGGNPYKIAAGPGGYWFTDRNNADVVQINSSGVVQHTVTTITSGTIISGQVCTALVPCSLVSPDGISAGPDGNVWVADADDGIIKITPGGSATAYPVALTAGQPMAITAGPDGNLWFTLINSSGSNGVGRITPSGATTYYTNAALTGLGHAIGILAASDGNIWFDNDQTQTITQVVL